MAFKGDSIYWVEVDKVVPNPFQPRLDFDEKKLQELAESIRMYGVLQPLTVTRSEVQREDGTFYTKYEIIAGERRLRASKIAGVAQVPVIIREGEQSEQEKLELAIIENLQREDLNAVDRALAFRQLSETFGLSHVQVAKKMGRSREYVSNSIRLLNLPSHILDSLKRGDMMEGHGRTLLMLTDRPEEQEVVYKEILLKKLSVREVERIVRKIATDKIRKKHQEFDIKLIELEKKFTETLGTRVQIQKTDFGGKLTIDYFSEDDLAVILEKVSKESQLTNERIQDDINKISSHTALQVDTPAFGQPESVDSLSTDSEFTFKAVVESDETQALKDDVSDNFSREEIKNYESSLPKEDIETAESVTEDKYDSYSSVEKPGLEDGEGALEGVELNQQPVVEAGSLQSDLSSAEFLDSERTELVNQIENEDKEKMMPENEDESDLYSIRNFGV